VTSRKRDDGLRGIRVKIRCRRRARSRNPSGRVVVGLWLWFGRESRPRVCRRRGFAGAGRVVAAQETTRATGRPAATVDEKTIGRASFWC